MSDRNIELTRRKVLGGLASIGAASAAAGAGTMAYFSDDESVDNNTVSAGTLDLTSGTSSNVPFNVTDTEPGKSGAGTITLNNAGTLDGVLDAKLSGVTNTESSSGEYSDSDAGELGDNLEVRVWVDVDNSGGYNSGDIVLLSDGTTHTDDGTGWSALSNKGYDTLNNYGGDTWNNIRTMTSGDTDVVNVEWRLPTSTGNDVQGDEVSFDLTFQLRQSNASGL